MNKEKKFLTIYWLLAIVYLLWTHFNIDVNSFLKPLLLLPLLLIPIFSKNLIHRYIVLAALAFSWLGDILLLRADFFIFGLVAFLTAHVFYTLFFIKELKNVKTLFSVKVVTAAILIVYGVGLLMILVPHAKGMEIPLVVYAVIISLMLYLAILEGVATKIWAFPLGAFFFVSSDSILAINKFYQPVISAHLLIMSTYLLAQGYLIYGIVKKTSFRITSL